jgi:hypothetical protein
VVGAKVKSVRVQDPYLQITPLGHFVKHILPFNIQVWH